MAIIGEERHVRLRLGVGVTGGDSRVESGVIVISDIPANSQVFATVDRPTEIVGGEGEPSDGGAAALATQGYVFERAQFPAQFNPGGAATPRPLTLNRFLVQSGNGFTSNIQQVPVFANFAVVQNGALVQKGRKQHSFPMPGGNIFGPDRHILRMRWTATVAGPVALATGDGVLKTFSGTLATTKRIVPGTFTVSAANVSGAALTLRDNGDGRIVGVRTDINGNVEAWGDGFISYFDGQWRLTFSAAPAAATAITATTFEHNCLYRPLDALITWDALLQ